ncbi:MAG: hypothetical protein QOJ15_3726 [Bradyrhizobium sp.]|jgi:hypothetical protein|nr:hypothetical protein [Bradyrhizobium sp.]
MPSSNDLKPPDLTRVEQAFDFEQWARLGFAIADRPVLASDVGDLRSEYARLIRDLDELPHPPARYAIKDPQEQDSLDLLSHPHWSSGVVERIALSPDLGRLAADLLGVRRIRLWGTSFICKYAGAPSKNAIRWHRDMTSWQCLSAPRLLTFWVALESVSPANGGMEFAAGSHRVEAAGLGDDADLDDYDGHPIVGPAGTMSAHHCLTGHRSGPNRSPSDRIAMTLHYMDADLHYVPGTASDKHINVSLIADRNNEIDETYFPIVYGA